MPPESTMTMPADRTCARLRECSICGLLRCVKKQRRQSAQPRAWLFSLVVEHYWKEYPVNTAWCSGGTGTKKAGLCGPAEAGSRTRFCVHYSMGSQADGNRFLNCAFRRSRGIWNCSVHPPTCLRSAAGPSGRPAPRSRIEHCDPPDRWLPPRFCRARWRSRSSPPASSSPASRR